MNNLDPMILSKIPYNVHQPGRGYTHNTQLYNFFNKNLRFILAFKIKRKTVRFVKKKSRPRVSFNYRKLKRRITLRPATQLRTTSLTFITMAGMHLMTHTMVSAWPTVRDSGLIRRKLMGRRLAKIKTIGTLRGLREYRKLLMANLITDLQL